MTEAPPCNPRCVTCARPMPVVPLMTPEEADRLQAAYVAARAEWMASNA